MTVDKNAGQREPVFNLEDELLREFEHYDVTASGPRQPDVAVEAIAADDAGSRAALGQRAESVSDADIHFGLGMFMPQPEPDGREVAMQKMLESLFPEELEEVYLQTGSALRNIPYIQQMHEMSKSLVLERRVGNRIAPERKRTVMNHVYSAVEACNSRLADAVRSGLRPETLVVPLIGFDVTRDELQAGLDGDDTFQFWANQFGVSGVTLTVAADGEGMEMTFVWPAA